MKCTIYRCIANIRCTMHPLGSHRLLDKCTNRSFAMVLTLKIIIFSLLPYSVFMFHNQASLWCCCVEQVLMHYVFYLIFTDLGICVDISCYLPFLLIFMDREWKPPKFLCMHHIIYEEVCMFEMLYCIYLAARVHQFIINDAKFHVFIVLNDIVDEFLNVNWCLDMRNMFMTRSIMIIVMDI